MSDTPMTDAAEKQYEDVVDSDFARELERENAKLRKALLLNLADAQESDESVESRLLNIYHRSKRVLARGGAK